MRLIRNGVSIVASDKIDNTAVALHADYTLNGRLAVLSGVSVSSKRYVAYFRVSTVKQGQSGLGLDAQRALVTSYLTSSDEVVAEYVEVESGKGANALERRPQLRAALAASHKLNAVLVIAKLDRLARNVHFISGLIESGCEFVAADMPAANKAMIQMYAVMSEWERDQISERTRAALAAARARGVQLGRSGPANLRSNIEERKADAKDFALKIRNLLVHFEREGRSQRSMVTELNRLGIRAAQGGAWSLVQLQRVLARLADTQPGTSPVIVGW
jgi:DNA invertase Pin-like site-specific DNA recombinase